MARQAVENFRAQTYANKRLLVYDTSAEEIEWPEDWYESDDLCLLESNCNSHHRTAKTIGYLRNRANLASGENDILIHWDDDDWSHPDRISEQVRFLQSSGAGCVGYQEMLFWRTATEYTHADYEVGIKPHESRRDEAWLYRHPSDRYALGTSLCYWASAWKQRPFRHIHVGEDKDWINGVDTRGVTSLGRMIGLGEFDYSAEPRMIARIHSHNTTTLYRNGEMEKNAASINPQWKRVVDRDEQLSRIMEGE